jgi:DNA-binding HxlR family transcriptional regulator
VLKTQLDELVQHGLISKTVHDGFPPKVEYVLTSLGESILPVICQMHHWGEAYKEEIEGDKKQLMSNV